MSTRTLMATIPALALSLSFNAFAGLAFFDDFDGGQTLGAGVSGGFSGVTGTESVQGYAGLGTGGNVFGGDFLFNGSGGDPASPTVLTLSGLPAHDTISVNFLLAIIDTWDGGSFPPSPEQAPDYFNVHIDGVQVFFESFANADGAVGQTYVPATGVELANNVQLGFRNLNVNDLDDAYDMGLEPGFNDIPHSASTVTIEWFASGSGWGGHDAGPLGTDEAWALENVLVITKIVPEPATFTLWISGFLALLGSRSACRRKSN